MKDKHGKPPNGGRDILDRALEIAGCSFAEVPPVRVDRVMMPDGSAKEFRATKPGRGEFANMARERWSILEIMTIFQMLYLPGSIRDPKGILAWNAAEFRKLAQLATPEETRNFRETLHGLYQSALMTLGASAAMDGDMKGDIAGRTRYTINGLKLEIEKKQGDAKQLDRIEAWVMSTGALVKAHLLPRSADLEVTQKQLSEMLETLNARVGVRQIQRWEKYIKTDGQKGIKPPDGYTMQTRLTLKTATAWAETFAATKGRQLRTKVSFEARYGGRH